jgi:Protein of unknown function (DUF1116)
MAGAADTTEANRLAFERLTKSDPVLVDVRRVGDFVPGFTPNTILTSGPPMAWADYIGGQREAIIGGALFEGLAKDRDEAITKLDAGEIVVGGCHDFGCVGSLAGIYTASMPAFVVENRAFGNIACCNMYEGSNPRRLNYGVYDEGVRERLLLVQNEIVPVIAEALRRGDGIALKPIIKRALGMGDELHSRNAAAALLFLRELVPDFLALATSGSDRIVRAVKAMTDDQYFFLRLSMAAAKATADAARDVEGSSIVTAMAFNCRGFALRVSGLGDTWFRGPHATVEAKLFEGHTEDEITWMGGESIIAETIGLGGFAQASAPSLQAYQGGSYETMIARNKELYAITAGENPDYLIPALGFRGSPTGIDILKVVNSKVLPVLDVGIAGRNGGQIGAGVVRPPLKCFEMAAEAYRQRYSS